MLDESITQESTMTPEVSSRTDFDGNDRWSIEPYEALVFAETEEGVIPRRVAIEESIAGDVDCITQFVKKLIDTRSDRPLLTLSPLKAVKSDRPNTQWVKTTSGGEHFLQCLRIDLDRIIDKYPAIGKFNRYFGLFYDAVMCEVEFRSRKTSFVRLAKRNWLVGQDPNFFSDDELALFAQYSNDTLDEIREKGRGEEFGKWQRAVERQPKENEDRLLSLVDAATNVNHHLLVLRFDLGYGQFYCDPELSGEMAVSYNEMREHRVVLRRFLKRHLKERLPPGACKGMVFAIKLEYGLDKGYHFHVIVILNGDVVCRDGDITAMICEQWKVITKSKGGACNCNRRLYKRKGIGSIRRRDAEKLDVLRTEVIPYITKVDYYGRMVKPDEHRTFWSSHPPRIEANRKGRKRGTDEAE